MRFTSPTKSFISSSIPFRIKRLIVFDASRFRIASEYRMWSLVRFLNRFEKVPVAPNFSLCHCAQYSHNLRHSRRQIRHCQGGEVGGQITAVAGDEEIPGDIAQIPQGIEGDVAAGIDPVYRILEHIPIQIRIPALEQDWILGGPSSSLGVVVAGAEADQAGVGIVEATGEAEGLEAGVGVVDDPSPDVVVDPLGDPATLGIDHQADAAQMIGDEPVGGLGTVESNSARVNPAEGM